MALILNPTESYEFTAINNKWYIYSLLYPLWEETMKYLFLKTVLCIAFLLLASFAMADVPQTMNYQGRLTNSLGQPLDTTVSIKFTLYDDSTEGTQKWTETHPSVTVTEGLFNVQLGTISAISDTTVAGNNPVYMAIQVGSDQEIEPRTRLTSVPYSQRVSTVDGATGGSIYGTLHVSADYEGTRGPGNVEVGGPLWTASNPGYVHIYDNSGNLAIMFDARPGTDGRAIIGPGNWGSGYLSFVAGSDNSASGDYSTIGGGALNEAQDLFSTVAGGDSNFVLSGANHGTICGGQANHIYGSASFIGGGQMNVAMGPHGTIGGGISNYVKDNGCTIGGGESNCVELLADWGTVSGGLCDSVYAMYGTIGGGDSNTVTIYGYFGTIGGGKENIVNDTGGTIAGGFQNTTGSNDPNYNPPYASIGGGYDNTAAGSMTTIGGGQGNKAYGHLSTIGGGTYNQNGNSRPPDNAEGNLSTIGGGYSNYIFGQYATIAGGYCDTIFDRYGAIGGGLFNKTGSDDGDYTDQYGQTVGGGHTNWAEAAYSTIGGGAENTGSGGYSTISGGWNNSNGGYASVIPGGRDNNIAVGGNYSMAFGNAVDVDNPYRVAFFDCTISGMVGINRDDHDVDAQGTGILYPLHIGCIGGNNGNGAHCTAGGTWTDGSSRTFKDNFETPDGSELLRKISEMPVLVWNYKDSDERHIGPMAEDFVAAFDVGPVRESDGEREDRYLAARDVAGVALAAIKELHEKTLELEEKSNKIEQLEAQMAEMQIILEQLLAERQ
jgi:Chaperone of endosialidase